MSKGIIAVAVIAVLLLGAYLGYIPLPWTAQQTELPLLKVKLAYVDGGEEVIQGDKQVGKVVTSIAIEVSKPQNVEIANYTLAYGPAILASGSIYSDKSIAVPLSALPTLAPKGLITFTVLSEIAEGVIRLSYVQIVKINATIAGGQVKVESVEQYPKDDKAVVKPPEPEDQEEAVDTTQLNPIIDSKTGITKYVDREGKVRLWSPPSGYSGDKLKLPPGTNNPMSKRYRSKVKEIISRDPDAMPGYEETPDGEGIRLKDPNAAGLIAYDPATGKRVKLPPLPDNDWSTYKYGRNWVVDPATGEGKVVIILPPGSNPKAYGVSDETIDLTDDDPNT